VADWDASAYDRVADPQEEWGREVLERLELRGDETVLDAGCGSGRVTRHLVERLPQGRVIGIDASPSMIEHARAALEKFGDRVELRVGDISTLELADPVDAVFSNATFHWILDHPRLFDRMFAALRPGGALEAQFGGEDNVAEWKRAIEALEGDERFSPYLRGLLPSYYFASVGDTRARLERSGFAVRDVWIEDRIVTPREPRAYVASVGSAELLERLPQRLHDEFIDAMLGSMARPLTLHYKRLNVSATRPG